MSCCHCSLCDADGRWCAPLRRGALTLDQAHRLLTRRTAWQITGASRPVSAMCTSSRRTSSPNGSLSSTSRRRITGTGLGSSLLEEGRKRQKTSCIQYQGLRNSASQSQIRHCGCAKCRPGGRWRTCCHSMLHASEYPSHLARIPCASETACKLSTTWQVLPRDTASAPSRSSGNPIHSTLPEMAEGEYAQSRGVGP